MPAPEEKAAELLADVPSYLWDGRRLPVPVEEIVDSYLGLRICDAEHLSAIPGAPAGATLSGLLVVTDRKVYVNAGEAASSPGRRRFTIGHEAGHWCLHRDSRDTVFCRGNGHGLDALPDDAPDIEDEASRFAGALLFPPTLVRSVHTRARGDVAKIAERFGASRVATERAIFRDVHRDAVRQRAGDEAVCFYWDDEGYDAWRTAHARDGFVANDNFDDPAGARLHRAGCSYLNRPAKEGQPRTRVPKWCSTEPGALRRALPEARVCTSCETAFRQSPPRKS